MVVVDYLDPEVGHQEEVSTNSHTVQETPKVDRGAILGGGVGNNTTGLVWSGLVRSGPVRSGPVRSGPVRSGPVRSGLVWSGLV